MNRIIGMSLCALAATVVVAATAHAQLADKKAMTLAGAKAMAAAAEASAAKLNIRGVIVVLDEGGNLIYFERDGGVPGSYDLAMHKARAAYMYGGPTKNFQDGLTAGRTGILGLPNVIPFEGGIPLKSGDALVGAIGISMGTPPQDGEVAAAAAAALK